MRSAMVLHVVFAAVPVNALNHSSGRRVNVSEMMIPVPGIEMVKYAMVRLEGLKKFLQFRLSHWPGLHGSIVTSYLLKEVERLCVVHSQRF